MLGIADQLLCEGPVCGAGLGFRGVLHDGEAPTDGVPHLDRLRDGRFEHPDFIPKGTFHIGPGGAVEVGAQIASGKDDTLKLDTGVQTPPVLQHACNEVAQPLRGIELRADGDEHAVRRREGVGHEGTGGPVGVDDDVIVVGTERGKDLLQEPLCAHLGEQVSFQLG